MRAQGNPRSSSVFILLPEFNFGCSSDLCVPGRLLAVNRSSGFEENIVSRRYLSPDSQDIFAGTPGDSDFRRQDCKTGMAAGMVR